MPHPLRIVLEAIRGKKAIIHCARVDCWELIGNGSWHILLKQSHSRQREACSSFWWHHLSQTWWGGCSWKVANYPTKNMWEVAQDKWDKRDKLSYAISIHIVHTHESVHSLSQTQRNYFLTICGRFIFVFGISTYYSVLNVDPKSIKRLRVKICQGRQGA